MKAWLMEKRGGPEALRLAERPVPKPAAGELLVRVGAAALNFSDLLMLNGTYQVKPPLPFVPGQEIAGTIEATGERIASKVLSGGFAEYALARADMAIRLPEAIALETAATLPVVWPTAWIALFDRAKLAPGETVLVLAAAGATGLAACQLAAAAGARVIAAAGGGKAGFLRSYGIEDVVDYATGGWVEQVLERTGGRGVQAIFDPVGGEITGLAMKCLARGGRLLIVGFASGGIPALKANRLLLKNASALGVYWSHERDAALVARAFDDIWARQAAGRLRFAATRTYPFAELPGALDDLAARRTTGKSVLKVA